METAEQIPQPDYLDQFKNLPYDSLIEIPMSMITPITIDDNKSSKSDGPIVVFYKEKNNTIFIDDGNHRYFDKKNEISKAQNNYENPDLSKEIIIVQKIDPKKAINNWILEV